MAKENFTSGPWLHIATSDSQLVETKSGFLIAEIAQDETYGFRALSVSEAEANARLIAAAPDLLAACKLALSGTTNPRIEPELKAAIAKAEGK